MVVHELSITNASSYDIFNMDFFLCMSVCVLPSALLFGYNICDPRRLIKEVVEHSPPPLKFAHFTAPPSLYFLM